MKVNRKLTRILVVCLCILNINSVFVLAETNTPTVIASDSDSSRYVETGYKYTTINGVCYRRLWNYTAGEWVDAYWTRCPASSHNH